MKGSSWERQSLSTNQRTMCDFPTVLSLTHARKSSLMDCTHNITAGLQVFHCTTRNSANKNAFQSATVAVS